MRPELQRLFDDLTATRAKIAAVTETERPATNGWTVAQVMDHLGLVHDETLPRFEIALASAPLRRWPDPVRTSLIERQVVKAMGGSGLKIPVPKMFEPGFSGPEAKSACLQSIDAVLDLIRRADEKALAGARVASPVNARLRLGFLPYLEGIVAHAGYHAGQISRNG